MSIGSDGFVKIHSSTVVSLLLGLTLSLGAIAFAVTVKLSADQEIRDLESRASLPCANCGYRHGYPLPPHRPRLGETGAEK